MNACDIDNQTKEWLAVNYTQEKVPAFDHKQAMSPRDAPIPSPARPIAMYQSLDLGNLKEWEWDIFSFEPAELLPVLVSGDMCWCDVAPLDTCHVVHDADASSHMPHPRSNSSPTSTSSTPTRSLLTPSHASYVKSASPTWTIHSTISTTLWM